MFGFFRRFFKMFGKFLAVSNANATQAMFENFGEVLQGVSQYTVRQLNNITKIGVSNMKKFINNTVKAVNVIKNTKFFSGQNDNIDFSKSDRRAIAPEGMPETSAGQIDFEDIFADDLETLPTSEIDFGNDTPAWVEEAHKKELTGRSPREIKEDMMFAMDESEVSSKKMTNAVEKAKLKQHFVNAKVEKTRARIRLENKPEWRKPK